MSGSSENTEMTLWHVWTRQTFLDCYHLPLSTDRQKATSFKQYGSSILKLWLRTSMCKQQSQSIECSSPFTNHFLRACNHLFPPFSQNWKWNEKQKEKQVCWLISVANGNMVTLSFCHSLTEGCSYEFQHLFEGERKYMCKPYMREYINAHIGICILVFVCVCVCTSRFPCAWLVQFLRTFAFVLKMILCV